MRGRINSLYLRSPKLRQNPSTSNGSQSMIGLNTQYLVIIIHYLKMY